MQRSTDRMLTTHVGSLPRPPDLLALLQSGGRPFDDPPNAARLRAAIADVVRLQAEVGLDIVDDGELGKPSFVTYVHERLGGFEPGPPRAGPWTGSREVRAFPEFYRWAAHAFGSPAAGHPTRICTGPITYQGHAALARDLHNLRAALAGVRVADAFVPAISPSNIEDWQQNQYYETEEAYLFAIADAMREEYRAIVDAGFIVQVDDPRLSTYYVLHPEASLEQCRNWAALRVEALNHALRDIPEDRIRFHTCYGINIGPRVYDMALKDIVDVLLRVRAGAYSFEAANPRHEHEWRVWERVKVPDGRLLIPGVISQSTILVEHPELVAERILRFASVVGRERVIAGADCGFATFAGSLEIHPSIVWAKLAALVEGARLATKALWGPGA
jgi:5-methyltetrahydropteroyltriglutamate--homocysteine methyltransferase